MTAAQPPDDSALGRPPHPPSPVRNPIRQMFMVNDVQNRWPFALRAAACMAVPALIGWLAGDLASGLMATIGAFTSLYGSGRPYLNRGVHLGVVAVCFALAVALGDWAAEVPWAGVLTVSVIAMAAVLVCNAVAVGPPGAYMFVLACATGTGVASEHLAPWRIGLLVLAGGGYAWLVHMFGALINVRGPEKSAVVSAAPEVARFADAVGEDIELRTIDVESLILAVSVDHRLSVEPIVSMADLRNEPFVAYESRDSAVNDAVLRGCRQAGFVPHRGHAAPGTAVLLALVAAGLGVAVVPASVRSLPLDGLVFRDLLDAGSIELALAWRRGEDNPVVEAVVGVLEAAFQIDSLPAQLATGGSP